MPSAPTKPMTYQYLLDTQAATAEQTFQRTHGVSMNMPSVLDALFQMSHMHRLGADETGFHFWAQNTLLGAPYTAADLYAIWQRGSYLEAVILLRHLVEILVQLRFYNGNRETYLRHVRHDMQRRGGPIQPTGPSPQRPVLKTMFEAVAPGFYDRYYGPHLSSTAHGGMMATLYRSALTPGREHSHQHVPGAYYDEGKASYLLTYLFPVLHGLLRIHFTISPDILDQSELTTRSGIEAAVDWVRQAIQSDWDSFPNKRQILEQLQPLADWKPRT